jgi:hypothetical protein
VLRRIGGIAITTSATRTGQIESGSSRNTRITSPSVGSARQKLLSVFAARLPRPVWPISRPAGSAMSAATNTPSAEYQMCSSSRAGIPSGPDHCSDAVSQSTVSPMG